MASTILGNGSITFADSTTLSTGNVPYTNFTSRPTALSQFTNNLGNYGGWMTISNVYLGGYNAGFHSNAQYWSALWNGTQMQPYSTNCNCNCNC
jgi:hypothetical protein